MNNEKFKGVKKIMCFSSIYEFMAKQTVVAARAILKLVVKYLRFGVVIVANKQFLRTRRVLCVECVGWAQPRLIGISK